MKLISTKKISVPQFESLKRQAKKTPFRRRAQKMERHKKRANPGAKNNSQNSEAFLWMDESIKKKRKCKRGYDEKLGENSTLQTFSPRLPFEWRIFPCFSISMAKHGRAARRAPERIGDDSWERIQRMFPSTPKKNGRNEAFPSLKLQHCETEAANHFFFLVDYCISFCSPEGKAHKFKFVLCNNQKEFNLKSFADNFLYFHNT